MRFTRVLTAGKPNDQPIAEWIRWRAADAVIVDGDGKAIFEQKNVEVPEGWSQNAANILAQKYLRRAGVPQSTTYVLHKEDAGMPYWLRPSVPSIYFISPSGETSARQVFHRLAGCWTYWGWRTGLFKESPDDEAQSEANARAFYDEVYACLALQYAAPNSPQWFNCFSGNERIITRECGAMPLRRLARENPLVNVWTRSGWTEATVRSFGIQPLQRVTFRAVFRGKLCDSPGIYKNGNGWSARIRIDGKRRYLGLFSTPDEAKQTFLKAKEEQSSWTGGKSKLCVKIDVTRDHRWIKTNGDHTVDLKVNDTVLSSIVDEIDDQSEYDDGFRHGIIFGDGTFGYKHKTSDLVCYSARLCGAKSRFAHMFARSSYPDCYNGDALVALNSEDDLKSLPARSRSIDYIRGFLDGWIEMDGSDRSAPDTVKLNTICEDAEDWLKRNAAAAGWLLVGGDFNGYTGGGYNSVTPVYEFRLTRAQRAFRVISIEPLEDDEVFCAVVPSIGEFTLASGILTGNCGMHWAYGIEGPDSGQWAVEPNAAVVEAKRIGSSYVRPQVHACYILSIVDSLVGPRSIMQRFYDEALIFKYGSGSGINFSPVRGKDEPLSGGGRSSGVMSFLRVGDRGAGSIQSGGTTRRAALMRVLNIDHPEIEAFVDWKVREEAKAAAIYVGSHEIESLYGPNGHAYVHGYKDEIIPQQVIDRANVGIKPEVFGVGYEGEAIDTVSGQNSNNSVRVPDEFLSRVDLSTPWQLINRVDGSIAKELPAVDLWRQIYVAAWACADPGLQFDDTINAWHTCAADGRIDASNPCSEYLFLDDTSCNLASLRLTAFLCEDGSIDLPTYKHVVRLWTTVLDISVSMSSSPTKEVAEGTFNYRTLGLGYADLGGLLMRTALPYASDEGRSLAAGLTALMTGVAYRTSAEMAQELGPFPRWAANAEHMRRVLRNHARAAWGCTEIKGDGGPYEGLNVQPYVARGGDSDLWSAVDSIWAEIPSFASFRNAQVTLLAPTGTISFVLDCDTTGVEPDFALVKRKALAGGGSMSIVNQAVPVALRRLGYDGTEVAIIQGQVVAHGHPITAFSKQSIVNCHLRPEHASIFACANDLAPEDHVAMVAAVQPFLSGGVSKTINMPRGATVDDVDRVYRLAHRLGLKSVSVYRDGSKLTQPLASGVDRAVANSPPACPDVNQEPPDHDEGTLARYAAGDYRHDAPSADVKIAKFGADLSSRQQPLGPEFSKVLADNLEGLYVRSDSPGAPKLPRGEREYLPWRRERGSTWRQKVKIGDHGHTVFVDVSEYADGRPGEVFLEISHEGSTLRALADCLAIAISIGLQYGVPVEKYVDKLVGTRFEPAGYVEGHGRIRFASSIADYIGRELGITYAGRDDLANAPASVEEGVERIAEASARLEATDPGWLASAGRVAAYHASGTPSGDPCPTCGELLRRTGTCRSCANCGYNEGCAG